MKTIILWKLGSRDRPVDDNGIKDFKKKIKKLAKKGFKTKDLHHLVTHHDVQAELISVQ